MSAISYPKRKNFYHALTAVAARWMSFPLAEPLALLLLCLICYSLLTPWLGYYWDDLPFLWISRQLGPERLAAYFATNRPLLGSLVRITTSILGSQAWQWQIFAVFCRWFAAAAFWLLLRRVWTQSRQIAFWAALLFVVYPGTPVQYISVVFSHFFIILGLFFLSLLCSLAALEKPQRSIAYTLIGLVLSALNLLVLDYFFMLELLRPLMLWWFAESHTQSRRMRWKKTFYASLPYLILFAAVFIWRTFFFSYQTTNYQPALLQDFLLQPLPALGKLLITILASLWVSAAGAWLQVFDFSTLLNSGKLTSVMYIAICIGTGLLAAFALIGKHKDPRLSSTESEISSRKWGWQALLAGAGWLLLAGPPYWLVDLSVNLGFPNSRVLLSFLPGASLVITGILGLLPLPRHLSVITLSILTGLAAGYQFHTANIFRRDWDVQNQLFWQMSWRMPGLQPGTTLLINDLPLHFSTDNSLTAPLNWMYAPGRVEGSMPYLLYYPSLRLGGGLPSLSKNVPLEEDYLALTFTGSTSQVVALSFNPPGCLRVLDPALDSVNPMQTELMRQAAALSDSSFILPFGSQSVAIPPQDVFNPEPAHGWCYYFAQAELARQQGNWNLVVALGEEAFSLNDYPNDPAERLVFIEGYAHVGEWEKAIDMTRQTVAITDLMKPVVCRLWQRIDLQTPSGVEKNQSLSWIRDAYSCE